MKGTVYVSEARSPFDEKALDELASRAAAKNARLRITGYLYYENERFLQYIEGAREDVDALMSQIAQDQRHTVKSIAHDQDFHVRRFPTWHMRRLRHEEVSQVRMEHVLSDYMLVMKTVPAQAGRGWEGGVWRMVKTIAEVQGQLNAKRA